MDNAPNPLMATPRPVLRVSSGPVSLSALIPVDQSTPGPRPSGLARLLASPPLRGPATVPTPKRAPAVVRYSKRAVFFWRPRAELIQLSLYGPLRLVPGHPTKWQAYAHPTGAYASVKTLAHAFLPDAELIAAGYLDWEIRAGETIDLHLAVANAGVSVPTVSFRWLGQPLPRTFDVFAPWDSPAGLFPATLSAGIKGVQAATVPFEIEITPRNR
jgi:hypothetical protein